MLIYKFLLDHFTDEQRFSITTKISHSVLGKGHLGENKITNLARNLYLLKKKKPIRLCGGIFLSFLALLFPLK